MPDTDPQYDPSKVYFNGAAIGLVTSLINGLRDEIRAVERRQSEELAKAVTVLTGDVNELEQWRESEMTARVRRDGQWSVARNAARFADRYGRIILAAAIAGAVTVIGLLGGVRVSVGP